MQYLDLFMVFNAISSLKMMFPCVQFLQCASLEASEVLSDIRNSLVEQQKMLAFSAEKQAEVCGIIHNIVLFVKKIMFSCLIYLFFWIHIGTKSEFSLSTSDIECSHNIFQ